MAKNTEKRLIKTLEFLKEPHGSTIPTIVKAMNGEDPKVSLKKIVQTLRGCLQNGILKVSDGRVKFKEVEAMEGLEGRSEAVESSGKWKGGCPGRAVCSTKAGGLKAKGLPKTCFLATSVCETNACVSDSKICMADGEPPGGEGGGDPENPDDPSKKKCRKPRPKCKKKKPKCKKPKPKCPRKPKCPKPKPKCPKPKPKCPKPKPKCPKPKKCDKLKIQPSFKKKKKTEIQN